ncbi:Crp/Fnr family transcriptional regulator [Chitinophaga solisilvae]|uniref:Crp/Fnr family transcriptional regulator n=1 Tax=Chitinophaga solisilvae TaxID=1233460 RepID=A0A3S1BNK5_9BACT|nr:Crp/Fnr family transcriptional regulator [Chitinophaga solisilvae]NSL87281.1 Crp/Fnr family transcriptional regulator [Chitinophaga solisilvae]
MFQQILKNIARHVTLTSEEADEFCSLLEVKQVKKRAHLIRYGEICDYEGYVNKGSLRTFFKDPEGAEHTVYLAIEDWWISDLNSRIYKTPSRYEVVALEDAEVFLIRDEALEAFLAKVPCMEHFYRKLFQYSVAVYQEKLLQAHQLTAAERYRYFRNKYPEFDRRIPQKYIASFLGLTPEFFNTVRSQVLKKE